MAAAEAVAAAGAVAASGGGGSGQVAPTGGSAGLGSGGGEGDVEYDSDGTRGARRAHRAIRGGAATRRIATRQRWQREQRPVRRDRRVPAVGPDRRARDLFIVFIVRQTSGMTGEEEPVKTADEAARIQSRLPR